MSRPVDVAVFDLGGRRFALDIEAVESVVPLGPLTPVPGAPASLIGVMNVRGRVLPVLDLSLLLVGEPGTPRPGDESLLLGSGDLEAVGVVGRIRDIAALPTGSGHEEREGGPVLRQVQTDEGTVHLVACGPMLRRVAEEMAQIAVRLRATPCAPPLGPLPDRGEEEVEE